MGSLAAGTELPGKYVGSPAPTCRHRVDPAVIPGVAAHDAPRAKDHTLHGSMHPNRLQAIGRATRMEAATRRQEWRDGELIPTDERNENGRQQPADACLPQADRPRVGPTDPLTHTGTLTSHRAAALPNVAATAARRSRSSSQYSASSAWGRALMTRSQPAGSSPTRPRPIARSRRDTRCRTTELPTVRPTARAIRAGSGQGESTVVMVVCTTRQPRLARTPAFVTLLMSAERRSR